MKVGWDDSLPEDISERWKKSVIEINLCSDIAVSRAILSNVTSNDVISIQIHGFSDASLKACGACVYLRIETSEEITVKLIAAKTKIAPLKGETIPRLELIAAFLLSQLITSVHQALSKCLKIDRIVCWCDSQV